jgi:DNA-binding XRE family transcriptional regulator
MKKTDKIIRLRSRLGMTQHEMAIECGYKNKCVISNAEKGHREPSFRMAKALTKLARHNGMKISLEYFLED